MTPDRTPGWAGAEQRAVGAIARHWPGGPALADPASWDVVAVRGILAVVVHCLCLRGDGDTGWGPGAVALREPRPGTRARLGAAARDRPGRRWGQWIQCWACPLFPPTPDQPIASTPPTRSRTSEPCPEVRVLALDRHVALW